MHSGWLKQRTPQNFVQHIERSLHILHTSRVCRGHPAETLPPSVMSGFNISVHWPNRLYPSGSCVSSGEKLMNFMHFHNSSTQNCDYNFLLIMIGNVHKESCHKLLSLILVREQGLHVIKTDCSGKMVVAFTVKEKNYLTESIFSLLVLPLSYLYLWY